MFSFRTTFYSIFDHLSYIKLILTDHIRDYTLQNNKITPMSWKILLPQSL